MEYSSEERKKTSVSVRPSLWEEFVSEAKRRGYGTGANALEELMSEWLKPETYTAHLGQEIHRMLDDLLASPEADMTIDAVSGLHEGMMRRKTARNTVLKTEQNIG